MSIVLDGTAGITTPEITSAGGPLVVNVSAPDNSVVVDASGNVGIGTSAPAHKLQITGNAFVPLTSSYYCYTADYGMGTPDSGGLQVFTASADSIRFGGRASGTFTERARIDSSGNLLVGTTSTLGSFGGRLTVLGVSGQYAANIRVATNGDLGVNFQSSSGGQPGYIQVNTSSVVYASSSDYRLKHDIQPMTGALAKVQQLKPVTYKWNVDDSADEGFIAHELQEVCPSAVTGEKDAVDAEGNPQYQGIDTSFLVATLTAAIQELKAINDAQAQTIESLTARVVALEGQP